MAKITRFNGNLVAPASAALGTERTLFGDVTQSDDLTDQFTADLLRGWGIVGPSDQPTLQDFNAMGFTLGQIHAYLHQVGVPEWNALQEFHVGSVTNRNSVLYVSLINDNVGDDPELAPASWKAYDAPRGSAEFTSAGASAWIVPTGVTRVHVCVIGGGGGGGKRSGAASASAAGGGAGGGISEGFVTVTPGASITVTVGAAGLGATTVNTQGQAGGTSSFGAFLSATGGVGGGVTSGGAGGVGTGGSFNSSLGPGQAGINFSNSATVDAGLTGAGGGPGGSGITFNSGSGSINGNPATGPGGGGSGAAFAGNGGNGFAGFVEIKW